MIIYLLGTIILSVNDDDKWQQNISDIMIDASAQGIAVLGLCYGHQLIGHIYGGKVGPLWSGEKKQGERVVHVKKSVLWGAPTSGPLLYSHQDGITQSGSNPQFRHLPIPGGGTIRLFPFRDGSALRPGQHFGHRRATAWTLTLKLDPRVCFSH